MRWAFFKRREFRRDKRTRRGEKNSESPSHISHYKSAANVRHRFGLRKTLANGVKRVCCVVLPKSGRAGDADDPVVSLSGHERFTGSPGPDSERGGRVLSRTRSEIFPNDLSHVRVIPRM